VKKNTYKTTMQATIFIVFVAGFLLQATAAAAIQGLLLSFNKNILKALRNV
jgi:hypothetical protein